jgi:large subunit ribosomal protein L5
MALPQSIFGYAPAAHSCDNDHSPYTPMAATEPSRYLARSVPRAFVRSARPQAFCSRRNASDDAPSRSLSNELNELESGSSLSPSIQSADASSYDPISIARSRKEKLPSSR